MNSPQRRPRRPRPGALGGFTLFEVAIVLVIVSLLLGAALPPVRGYAEARLEQETLARLDRAREALVGFAVSHGHLPCPDRDGDGESDARVEGADAPGDGCAGGAYGGWLPAATLGTPSLDAWGRRIRYRVSAELTRRAGDPSAIACAGASPDNPCTLEIGDTGELTVLTRDPGSRVERRLAVDVAAVVLSLGPNGRGGGLDGGTSAGDPPDVAEDEWENLDGDGTYMSRDHTPAAEGCSEGDPTRPPCAFDDRLAWVSPHVLIGRLVSAGQLP